LSAIGGGQVLIGDTVGRTIAGIDPNFQVTGTGSADTVEAVQAFSADAVGPKIIFGKSRAAAIGTYTLVLDNDVVADFSGYAADGVDMNTEIARIRIEVDDAAPAASDIGGAVSLWTASGGGADDIAKKVHLRANGQIGINIDPPTARFHVVGVGNETTVIIDQAAQTGGTASALEVLPEWNQGSNTFIGLLVNATNTASSAATLLADFQVGGVSAVAITKTSRLGIGIKTSLTALVHADQSSASGAIPVLALDQGDIDDTFINFIGTSAADGTRSISSDTTEDSAKFGAIRVEINGVLKWVRIYDDES